jgi:HEAT repeat protein
MSPAVASVLQGARSFVSSVVEGLKPFLSPLVRTAEPVISSTAEVAESGISSALRAAAPLTAPLHKLLLKSPNPKMRRKAVEKLSGSSRPSDTELLFARLNDESPQVRCAAVRALARAKTPENLRSLVAALQDEIYEVREASARALGTLGDVSSTRPLAGCLRDPDAAVRTAAAGALRSMGWRPSTRQELAWYEITLATTPAPVPADPAIAAPPDPIQDTTFFRRLAAQELKENTNPARIKQLRAELRSGDLLTRMAAVHDLAQIKDPEVTSELLKLFRHPDAQMRLAAAQALAGRDGSPPAHFLGLLHDANSDVRLVAVQFLARIRHKHIAEVLGPLLPDQNLQVRQAVAAAISKLGV